jgi:phage tail sheath protein FI
MAVQTSWPGVRIEEVAAAGPIASVGTSTAGFLGPARDGEPNRPRVVTSFDEFRTRFGDRPLNGFYLWYAVRGFFENGGRRGHIVRVSRGDYARLELPDSRPAATAQIALSVRSRELGATGMTVVVSHTSYVTATGFRPGATVVTAVSTGSTIELASPQAAADFRAGDRVLLETGTDSEAATIRRVSGATLVVEESLGATYDGGTVRLVDLQVGDRGIRVTSSADGHTLGAGSVVRIQQGALDEMAVVASVQAERISPAVTTYRVELESGLATGPLGRAPGDVDINVTSQEFTLSVNGGAEVREDLSMARNNPRYFAAILAEDPFNVVVVEEPDAPSNAPLSLLRPAAGLMGPTDGVPDDPTALSPAEYQSALDALRRVDDVNFIAAPDSRRLPPTDGAAVQLALLTHCTQMADRFAIFDPAAADTVDNIRDVVDTLRSERGFGALYFPWIWVPHVDTGLILVPPSGHVAGVYARADNERGVHKAPANFILNGALGVAHDMNNEEQGVLNLDGINVLRVFPDSARPVVWGARTTSNETAWQYVNIRRLFLYIEESIEEGIRWAVFEPNGLPLWQKLKRTITEFLTRVWRDGALFGEKAEDAFYVRIDEVLNPFSEQALGRLTIEIGLRPTYPAEFIIVRIGIWPGGAGVMEG